MIYDYESFERESVIDRLADKIQKYLGIDLVSIFFLILSVSKIYSSRQ